MSKRDVLASKRFWDTYPIMHLLTLLESRIWKAR